MSSVLLALLFAFGCSGWMYNKTQHRNGGLTARSLQAAAVVAVVAFIVFLTLIATVNSHIH